MPQPLSPAERVALARGANRPGTAEIIGAELRGNSAQVTVRFVSQLITATRDRSGAVVDGNPDKVTDVTDVWTFARDVTSRDPNWKLVATEAGQ